MIKLQELVTQLNFKEKEFNTVYSHGVLEHFDDESLKNAIKEGLRVSDFYIISIPTIWDISNSLMGDERLKSIHAWKKFIKKQGYQIIETVKMYPTTPNLKIKLNYKDYS